MSYKMIVYTLITVIPVITGCAGWTINGLPVDEMCNKSDWIKFTAGVGLAYTAHFAGHLVASAATGTHLHMRGLSEVWPEDISPSKGRWLGRSGWLGAVAAGYIAKACGASGPLWEGFRAGVVFETATYPLWDTPGGGSDITYINQHDGHGRVEWGIATILAVGLYTEREEDRK